jgi:DDE superfamily endonuclease
LSSPRKPARHDYEYKRKTTAALWELFAPLGGWRHFEVTERRTAIGYAKILRDLADIQFPVAATIVLVQDNLVKHTTASLNTTFEPVEASRIIEQFEWHYAPKHGSRFDRAGSEVPVLTGQCLARRIADAATLKVEVVA